MEIFLRLLLLGIIVSVTSANYEYNPRERKNGNDWDYRDSDSWSYPTYANTWYPNYGGNGNRRDNRRSSAPQSQMTYASNDYSQPTSSSWNRIRSYDDYYSRPSYSPSLNEVDSPIPRSRRSRWYSNSKRQAPPATLKLDSYNRVQMGVEDSSCDDAKSNLTVDWNLSPVNYTCFHPETRFPRSFDAQPLVECETLPPRYVPGHVCMDQRIGYKDLIPTHGDHRPLWPKFGEYMFVPRERWLHNIEHGAIVMLYHPCAYPSEVSRLRSIVRGCVGKHVITPSTHVPKERPLALVAWGCRLLMSAVDDELAMNFIKTRAHRGPEGTYQKEGQYELTFIKSAKSSGNGAKYGYSKVTCDTLDRSRL